MTQCLWHGRSGMAAIRGTRRGTYRVGKRIQRRVLPMLLHPLQQEDFSVIGFGVSSPR
jgi:hypothetical protein